MSTQRTSAVATRPAAGAHQRGRITLPQNFRLHEVLGFHARDPEGVAEGVFPGGLHKGLLWEGSPARLVVRFDAGTTEIELEVDAADATVDRQALAAMVERMLGLTQPVDAFEALHRNHPLLGPLLARQSGLRVPLAASPFEALAWAITGQQISLPAAVSLRRRLIRLAGAMHSSGLACYPGPAQLAALRTQDLRAAGFSRAKAEALLIVSREAVAGRLSFEPIPAAALAAPAVEALRADLLAVPGIGPWTVDYTLLRGYGWLDGSLHGDVAVRRKLQRLLGVNDPIAASAAARWLEPFSPYRALVAAHLWAMPG